MKFPWPVLALALLGACRTVAQEAAPPALPEIRVGQRARTWEVVHRGQRVGLVVLFQDRGHIGDSVYVVRNVWHQDLGLIDGLGRAYRYLPHHKEPAWVGSGTIALGAERILCVEDGCELVELESTPEAGAERPRVAASEPGSPVEEPSESVPTPASSPVAPDEGLPQSL